MLLLFLDLFYFECIIIKGKYKIRISVNISENLITIAGKEVI